MKSVTIFGSARFNEDSKYYKEAFALCEVLAKNGYSITTGGGGGIMQAANKAAFLVGGVESVGINIKLPMEQKLNPYCTKSIEHSDLSLRKKALMQNDVMIVCAGGYGTLDELFEVLTLAQTKLRNYQIILYNEEFFKPLVEFFKNTLLKCGAIDEESLKIFSIANTPSEVLDLIK
ncbi:TIGR00730 family Rossman fold protein [Campylobacter sp. Cr9]|uniref:LOG family protein n=1 Tax=unclassified Campylobacter TaxID=2593542 RepID=UPI001EFB2DF7|nr:TIGR00730 family Rossman fold protein [Campylobacter sp. RM5004]MBZ7986203.1 TIGR00730 family Rossman fold protein [Campylobacter sp. Cr9]ULO01984.1 putative lysine decarboxylase family protein [Campylobacter sp. RM5004]